VCDDPWGDAYSIVPVELDWRADGGVAHWNGDTGVKFTHFPVIHCRKGSIGYKLERKGLSLIYTSDTKPEKVCPAGERPQADRRVHPRDDRTA